MMMIVASVGVPQVARLRDAEEAAHVGERFRRKSSVKVLLSRHFRRGWGSSPD